MKHKRPSFTLPDPAMYRFSMYLSNPDRAGHGWRVAVMARNESSARRLIKQTESYKEAIADGYVEYALRME